MLKFIVFWNFFNLLKLCQLSLLCPLYMSRCRIFQNSIDCSLIVYIQEVECRFKETIILVCEIEMEALSFYYFTNSSFKADKFKPICSLDFSRCSIHVEKVFFNMVFSCILFKIMVEFLISSFDFFNFVDPANHAFLWLTRSLFLHFVYSANTILLFHLI